MRFDVSSCRRQFFLESAVLICNRQLSNLGGILTAYRFPPSSSACKVTVYLTDSRSDEDLKD